MNDRTSSLVYLVCAMVMFGFTASELYSRDLENTSVLTKVSVIVVVAIVTAIMADAIKTVKQTGKE